MNTLLIVGITIVNLALIAYTIAFITFIKKKLVVNQALIPLSIGVSLDICATSFMIFGSSHSFLSTHGVIGYSSLLAMIIDCALLWKFRIKYNSKGSIPQPLQWYTRIAYIWWICAYIAGILVVLGR